MLSFQPFPKLETQRLLLRELDMSDDNEMLLLRSDDRVLEYTGIKKATSIQEVQQFIQRIIDLVQTNQSIFWAISLKDDPSLIGTICIWNINLEDSTADIGYMLHPDQQGKGLMNEAIVSTISYGFETMKLKRIDADVAPGNAASIKLLERNGFVVRENSELTIIYSLQNNQQ